MCLQEVSWPTTSAGSTMKGESLGKSWTWTQFSFDDPNFWFTFYRWTPDQLYDVVANVHDYKDFLPACHKSDVLEKKDNFIVAKLGIGIPPLISESYTSHVTLNKPRFVKAKCFDGRLFNHLDTEWNFIPHGPHQTLLDFRLDFEFKSLLHSKMANAMFDTMVRQTINAFIRRAREKHGPPAVVNVKTLREEV